MMWFRQQIASEWDMAWFCDKCEKMMSWKTKGWTNSLSPHYAYCNECKEEIAKAHDKWLRG